MFVGKLISEQAFSWFRVFYDIRWNKSDNIWEWSSACYFIFQAQFMYQTSDSAMRDKKNSWASKACISVCNRFLFKYRRYKWKIAAIFFCRLLTVCFDMFEFLFKLILIALKTHILQLQQKTTSAEHAFCHPLYFNSRKLGFYFKPDQFDTSDSNWSWHVSHSGHESNHLHIKR